VLAEALATYANVLDQKAEWDLLRHFDYPLDLIHRFDPQLTVQARDIQWRSAVTSPLVIGEHGRMHRKEVHA